MSAEALRTVFAEFGFKVDDKDLDALLVKTEETIKAEKSLSEVQKRALGELKKRKAEEDAAAKAKQKAEEQAAAANGTLADSLAQVHPALGKLAELAGVGGVQLTGLMVRTAGLATGVAALVVGLHRFAVGFAADVTQLREAADAARVTEHEFQALSHAGNAAGVSASAMASGLNTLGQGLRAIETRSGGPTGALWRLGVRVRNANGTMRETNDVLYDLADRFERVQHPVRRARLAQELFGANWRQMLRTMEGGSAALRRQHADFERLGGGVLPEAVAAGRGFTVAQGRMKVAMDSLRSVLATAVLPIFERVTNKVADFTGWLSRMTRGSNVVNVALASLGVVGAAAALAVIAAWGPVLAPFLAVGAGIALLVLLVDDLVTMFRGGNSAIGEFIDTSFGLGTTAELVEELTEDWEFLKEVFQEVKEILEFIVGLHQRILGGVVRNVGGTLRTGVNAVRHFLPAGAPETPALVPPPPEAGGLVDGPADRRRLDPRTRRAIERGQRAAARAEGPQLVDGSRLRASAAAPAWMQGGMVDGSSLSAPTAPMRAGTSRVTNTTTHHRAYQFHINGVTDPAAVARQVQRILTEQERQDRDQTTRGEA